MHTYIVHIYAVHNYAVHICTCEKWEIFKCKTFVLKNVHTNGAWVIFVWLIKFNFCTAIGV